MKLTEIKQIAEEVLNNKTRSHVGAAILLSKFILSIEDIDEDDFRAKARQVAINLKLPPETEDFIMERFEPIIKKLIVNIQ